MLDMQEWSSRLQTARSQAEYERLNLSVQLASITILYYDYALTFIDEVNYIWAEPRKLTTVFYVFCRYSLIANPLYMFSVSTTILECRTGYMISGVLSIFGHIGIIAVWGLRTSAVYKQQKAVSVFLGLLGTSVVVLLIIRAPFNQCRGPVKFQWLRGALAATMLFYEVSAWLLAVLRAWRTVREDVKFWDNPKQSLNYIIFSQGLIYISAVFLLSTLTITLNFHVNMIFARLLNSIKVPLSGVLTARFLIQLRKWKRRRTHFDSQQTLPSYDPNVSANIHFNHGHSTGFAPPKPSGSSEESAIQELGRDIGPRLRDPDVLNASDDDEVGMLGVDPLEERTAVRGKARWPPGEEMHEITLSSTESSPMSAVFSAGNLSRRNRLNAPTMARNGFESGSSSLVEESSTQSYTRTDSSMYASGSKSTHFE